MVVVFFILPHKGGVCNLQGLERRFNNKSIIYKLCKFLILETLQDVMKTGNESRDPLEEQHKLRSYYGPHHIQYDFTHHILLKNKTMLFNNGSFKKILITFN